MLKAYKYRIYPNNEQKIQIAKTFGCCRFVYNQTLAYRIDCDSDRFGRGDRHAFPMDFADAAIGARHHHRQATQDDGEAVRINRNHVPANIKCF